MRENLADNTDEPVQLDPIFLNLIETAYKDGFNGIDIPTTISNAEYLMDAVFKGFGGDFSTFAFDTPDYKKLAHIEKNVYQFSGAKNHHQLRDLTRAIKDGDRILSFNEFRPKAMAILEEYQGAWLQTEYNAAIAGSQMASKWVNFEKNPDALLQYRTQEDGRVRNSHALLNNTLRPVSDNFWKTWYPPNGWNCRCTVIERNTGRPTPESKMQYPEVPKMFAVNLGERGLVFPPGSAYFKGLPPEVPKQVETITPDRTNPRSPAYPVSATNNGWEILSAKGKGNVKRHKLVNTAASDYQLIETIAKEKAALGNKVEILPVIEKNDPLRSEIFNGAKDGKCPDLKINGVFAEVKQPVAKPYGKNTLSTNIKKAHEQADHVIIDLTEFVEAHYLERAADGRFKTHSALEVIEYRYKEKFYKYTRK